MVRRQLFFFEGGHLAPLVLFLLCGLSDCLRYVCLSEPRAALHANRCRFVGLVVAAVAGVYPGGLYTRTTVIRGPLGASNVARIARDPVPFGTVYHAMFDRKSTIDCLWAMQRGSY